LAFGFYARLTLSKSTYESRQAEQLDWTFHGGFNRTTMYDADRVRHGHSGVGELLIGLTKYFAFYNAERPHQSLGNQTPQHVHETSSGGGAMIVDKYRTKERLPVALRSSGTAFEEVRNDIWPAIPNAKTGAAPSSCEKSSAT
jgi:hypothetical protein